MTSPIRPLPHEVARWVSLAACLRWCDAAAAWVVLWAVLAGLLGPASPPAAVASLLLMTLGALLQPLRVLWRPVSGSVGLMLSRRLQPGDRAWYVRSRHADAVLVTGRHGARMLIATPDLDEPDEVLSVRRTRVLLLPADDTRPT
jgi:hypothetical protein